MTRIKFNHGDGGKKSGRRPEAIDQDESALRWELIKKTTTPERKAEINAILEKLKEG